MPNRAAWSASSAATSVVTSCSTAAGRAAPCKRNETTTSCTATTCWYVCAHGAQPSPMRRTICLGESTARQVCGGISPFAARPPGPAAPAHRSSAPQSSHRPCSTRHASPPRTAPEKRRKRVLKQLLSRFETAAARVHQSADGRFISDNSGPHAYTAGRWPEACTSAGNALMCCYHLSCKISGSLTFACSRMSCLQSTDSRPGGLRCSATQQSIRMAHQARDGAASGAPI